MSVCIPNEILLLILNFGIGKFDNETIHFVMNFHSLSKRLNSDPQFKQLFNEFWWKLLENMLKLTNHDQLMKKQIVEQDKMKRVAIIAMKITSHLSNSHPKDQKEDKLLNMIMVVGSCYSRKSLLTHQFMGVPFTEPTPYWKYSDYGNFIEFERKLKLDGISTTFNIHDAALNGLYQIGYDYFTERAKCFVLVLSTESLESLEWIQLWIYKIIPYIPVIFVLNNTNSLDKDATPSIIKKLRQTNDLNPRDNHLVLECNPNEPQSVSIIFEEALRLIRKETLGIPPSTILLEKIVEHDSLYLNEIIIVETKKRNQKCNLM